MRTNCHPAPSDDAARRGRPQELPLGCLKPRAVPTSSGRLPISPRADHWRAQPADYRHSTATRPPIDTSRCGSHQQIKEIKLALFSFFSFLFSLLLVGLPPLSHSRPFPGQTILSLTFSLRVITVLARLGPLWWPHAHVSFARQRAPVKLPKGSLINSDEFLVV